MLFGGVDEAGYGPLLGPLSIAAVSAEADDEAALKQGFRRARTGAKDSKQVHVSGDITAIESVALPAITWLTGHAPGNMRECLALLGEDESVRTDVPWMAGTAGVVLPIGSEPLKTWKIPGVTPRALRGSLIQPRAYNASRRLGVNKADIELQAVGGLLTMISATDEHGMIVVDRLGGRRYYRDFLQSLWPDTMVLVEVESPGISGYRIVAPLAEQSVSFRVDGESHSPLTAVASCIAKYVRELHMMLLNRHWCAVRAALKPTAGYAKDAVRWLDDLGVAVVDPIRDELVRGVATEIIDVGETAIGDAAAPTLPA